ncbi:MAG: FtsQ-type POTRA domain-containing protein [Eggerthellaceae bacterium]|nr:FtsQ-type POTRA domain-containing protein [Eggerthellaceae bacterium]
MRVGDLPSDAVRVRKGRAWVVRSLVALVLAGVLAVAAAFLFFSDVLSIEQVNVSGVRHLTAEEMQTLAAVPASSTLLRVDADAIAQRVKSSPWVEDVSVRRVFPHTLELQITERSVAAIVEVTSSEKEGTVDNWAISKEGLWLMLVPPTGSDQSTGLSMQIYEDASSVLHITDIPLDVRPEVGERCTDESVLNALAIVSGFTTTLADQVKVVSATDTANTLLTLDNGVQIAFGTADDIRNKERVCLKLMEEHPGQISYINVRVVERPTWRSAPTF